MSPFSDEQERDTEQTFSFCKRLSATGEQRMSKKDEFNTTASILTGKPKMLKSDQLGLKKQNRIAKHMNQNWQLYMLLILPIIYYLVIRYVPMIGNIIAFRKYRGGGNILGDEWVGIKYFKQFMGDKSFWRAFFNTLVLNISYLAVRFPLTILFALLLNEIRLLRWKKFVQTVSYLPHFMSMVIVAGMLRELLSASGPINHLITSLGMENVEFLFSSEWFPTIFVSSESGRILVGVQSSI